MVVRVEVNGKPIEMLFDTSSYFIALNQKTIQALHLPVPGDATTGEGMQESVRPGVSEFEVDSIRLGPITKRNMHVVSMSDSALLMPLLGQPFFNDYQYTVDNEHGLIHFLKR
jgi:predicted aspartyl protease